AQEMDVEKAGEFILNAKVPVLLYSDAVEKDMSVLRTKQGFESDAKIMEEFMSELARFCLEKQFDRIVVAGGETSGAVLKRLGFEQFTVGQSIAPGVPALIPHPSLDLCLILKSGNFGQDDFFIRALEDVYV
ncbi:nucleotide-binding domain containing protein, partial [uncultured Faecalicoccus sp.]|uniref:nucleotide-binding domain containing protein n=1 Tax=uncultured Faecalicoccus sp. TaxID=1971760 RepID=UPI00260E0715